MSRSDVPRADSRPGVRAPKPREEERRAPTPSAFTTTLAYGVASSRRSAGKDHPPPPPSQRPNPAPEPVTQRDSSSLLDLEAKPPEELHLRFEPVMGIAPDPRARHATPEPRHQELRAARERVMTPPEPRTRLETPDPRMRHNGHPGEYPTARTAPPQRRPPVPQQAVAPRLQLKHLELEDSSPTTKFATQPSTSGMKVRYWIYGMAVGLGAAALVAAGYSAAFVQMTRRDTSATPAASAAQTHEASQTTMAAATDRPAVAPSPAAPGRAAVPSSRAADIQDPEDLAQDSITSTSSGSGSRGKRAHNTRTRNAPTAAFEPTAEPSATPREDEEQQESDAPEPVAAAPHMEPNPTPAAAPQVTSAPSAPSAPAPAPRLIITPLPNPPEPSAPESSISAIVGDALEPKPSAAESAPKPAPEPAAAPSQPGENLPAQLSRDEIQQQLLGMRDKLATCAGTTHGTSYANVTINGTGRVSYSTIDGAFAGTPAGSCMARALRGATFPRFSGPQMTVRYPYVF